MEFKKLEFHDLELIRSYYSEYTKEPVTGLSVAVLCGVIIFTLCTHWLVTHLS